VVRFRMMVVWRNYSNYCVMFTPATHGYVYFLVFLYFLDFWFLRVVFFLLVMFQLGRVVCELGLIVFVLSVLFLLFGSRTR